MRVTNNMMISQSLRDINSSHERLARLNQEISSGKRIHRPSDDPTSHARSQILKNNLAQNDQYKRNTEAAQTFLSVTDTALGGIGNALQRVRELAVQAATGTLKAADRTAFANEVGQIREELRTLGNTQVNGRYIFGGVKTDTEVFPAAGVTTGPNNSGTLSVELAPNVTIDYNVTGVAVFGDTTTPTHMFAEIDTFLTALTANDQATIASASISGMDKWLDNVNQLRTAVGGRVNRLEMAQGRMAEVNVSLEDLLGATEGTDIPKASLQLAQTQATLQAALAAGSKAMPMSLVDFLR